MTISVASELLTHGLPIPQGEPWVFIPAEGAPWPIVAPLAA